MSEKPLRCPYCGTTMHPDDAKRNEVYSPNIWAWPCGTKRVIGTDVSPRGQWDEDGVWHDAGDHRGRGCEREEATTMRADIARYREALRLAWTHVGKRALADYLAANPDLMPEEKK